MVIIGGEVAAGAVHLTIVSESRGQKCLFIGYINQINLVKFTKAGRKAIKSVLWLCPKTEATLSVLKLVSPGKLRARCGYKYLLGHWHFQHDVF